MLPRLVWQAMLLPAGQDAALMLAREPSWSAYWQLPQRVLSHLLRVRLLTATPPTQGLFHRLDIPPPPSSSVSQVGSCVSSVAGLHTRCTGADHAGVTNSHFPHEHWLHARHFSSGGAAVAERSAAVEEARGRGSGGQDGSSRVMSFTAVQAHDPAKLHLAAYPRSAEAHRLSRGDRPVCLITTTPHHRQLDQTAKELEEKF